MSRSGGRLPVRERFPSREHGSRAGENLASPARPGPSPAVRAVVHEESPMKRTVLAALSALALSAGAALTGCGASGGEWARGVMADRASEAGPARGFNTADVMFLQMMVPHNGQGVELARLARERAAREEVRILAAAVVTAQEAETATMAGWLRGWDQPATAPADEHAAHGGMPETSEREIAEVTGAAPADFETRFLDTLIAHQDDAVQLARAEAAAGLHPEVRRLAERIDLSRTAQIEQMLRLRGR
ncbi:hypothetical protein Plo01_50040 [Planobispora longispora]|uniref:DUF305 domain-containing protein n=2 Tax=Planobispora longispora TaxID=28887 RepID=A0A8J3W796_9ACTN|nr:hypothetical protein Plo01_50040 [Planobispora longispora]